MNLTQPHIYKKDLKCPVCLDQEETWSHIYLCTPQQSSMQICIDLTRNFIIEKVEDHLLDKNDFEQELRDLTVWNIPSSIKENTDSRNPDYMDFIRGFIPYNLSFFFRRHLSPDFFTKNINELILSTQSFTIKCFKKWYGTSITTLLKSTKDHRGPIFEH